VDLPKRISCRYFITNLKVELERDPGLKWLEYVQEVCVKEVEWIASLSVQQLDELNSIR
jgi:hypothetical protein